MIEDVKENLEDALENLERLKEEENERANTLAIPYLTVRDQLKADQILEHWEKFTLEDFESIIS